MRAILTILFSIFAISLIAQSSKDVLREGNELYNDGKIRKAMAKYTAAVEQDPSFFEASFNLGDAMYREKEFEDASSQFEVVASRARTDQEKAAAYHNLGNAYLSLKDYPKSVEAFKAALRLNPADNDTRYNLAWAQAHIPPDQQGGEGEGEGEDQEQEGDEDQEKEQEGDKEGEQEGEQEQDGEDGKEKEQEGGEGQNKEQEKGEGDKKGKQGKEGEEEGEEKEGSSGSEEKGESEEQKMERQAGQRMLEAAEREEQKNMKAIRLKLGKYKKGETENNPNKIEKDW